MLPQTPVVPGHEDRETKIAEKQSEYMTLPALVCRDAQGAVISRWTLEDFERDEFLKTGNLYLTQLTFGSPVQPVTLSPFTPEVPLAALAAPASVAPGEEVGEVVEIPTDFFVEFRIVTLDRKTLQPTTSLESGAGVFVNITSLIQAMNSVAPPVSDDPDAVLRAVVDSHATLLGEMYGGDVYFRPLGSKSGEWLLKESSLKGKATGEVVERITAVVEVSALDRGTATVEESVGMMKALRSRFSPPFAVAGFSRAEAHDYISPVNDELAARRFASIDGALEAFRAEHEVEDLCVLIKCGMELERSFLLDVRLFDKARSN